MASTPDYDVIIVGGGPVGLLLGNMLGQKGLSTLLIEKTATPPEESMAIGITPPSLEIFQTLGLDENFVKQGVRVELAKVHEGRKLAGELSFCSLDNPYPFILAIPQATTIEVLEDRLRQEGLVTLRRETSLLKIEQTGQQVTATVKRGDAAESEQVTASFLVGCDGHRSSVRELTGIGLCEEKTYPAHFLMADFADDTDLGEEAHLFFSCYGSVESFPLPQGRRRWILQTDRLINPPDIDLLIKSLLRQTGYNLAGSIRYSESVFSVRRFVCQHYYRNRVVLCGDAAHVMSPIGGQGMNTGFADAEFLADALARHFSNGEDFQALLAEYDYFRRAAFNVAATRAERGMWLGTRRGWLASALRFLLLKSLLRAPCNKSLPAYFAMLTIPYRSLKAINSGQH
jgi:2-polyprenyl-6-methoxyphenol hydroxylase-like FAD-dependent oxidoreductase